MSVIPTFMMTFGQDVTDTALDRRTDIFTQRNPFYRNFMKIHVHDSVLTSKQDVVFFENFNKVGKFLSILLGGM